MFAPDMVWRIEGHSLASRECRNRQEFVDEVLAPFGARFAACEPFRPVTIRSIHADADTVIVVWDGRGVADDGRPYENSYVWTMRLAERPAFDDAQWSGVRQRRKRGAGVPRRSLSKIGARLRLSCNRDPCGRGDTE